MSDELSECPCGNLHTQRQSSGIWCYRCKLDGLSFNWVGGGSYGREAFHSRTNNEVAEQTVRNAAAIGINATKVSTRAELV